jgi:hypothetical protein
MVRIYAANSAEKMGHPPKSLHHPYLARLWVSKKTVWGVWVRTSQSGFQEGRF